MQTRRETQFTLSPDALFLLVLVMAHLWFKPVSSAFVITIVAVYIALALRFPASGNTSTRTDGLVFGVRLAVVLVVVFTATIPPAGWGILQRHVQGPATNVTDGVIQTEAAIQFLLEGKNPYTEDYLKTPLADWQGAEIAWTPTESPLSHNAYLPFLFIMSIPFYLVAKNLFGWYDQRFLYLLLYVVFVLLLPIMTKNRVNKLCLLITVGLNFLFAYFMLDGRNDIVILLGLMITTILLAREHISASAFVMGLTLMVKQTAWFFLPFYLIYLLPKRIAPTEMRSLLLKLWPLYLVVTVILTPFVVWDAASFFDDTISYLLGMTPESFPIRGWGLSNLLLALRLLPSPDASFPFGIIELAAGIPTLAFLSLKQRQHNDLRQVWLGFAIFSFVVQYLSRFFNDNYMVMIVQSLVIAVFMDPAPAERELPIDSPKQAVATGTS